MGRALRFAAALGGLIASAALAARARRELAAARLEIVRLTSRIAELESRPEAGPTPAGDVPDAHWSEVPLPTRFEDLIALAQEHLSGLSVPLSALQQASELNNAREREQWLRQVWNALGALHEYATEGGEPPLPPEMIVVAESNETLAKHGDSRVFAIDVRLSPSGKLRMESHVRPVAGNGPHVPRVYFHDDRDGVTGLVHVGFVGPRYLVPDA